MPSCLLEAADAVLEPGRARARPTGGPASRRRARRARRLGRRRSSVWLGSVANSTAMSGSVVDVGQPPGLGAVGQVAVGEEDHRGAVLDGDPGRLDGRLEAVRRASWRRRSGTGASPWRPYMAWSRSDCSVLVGRPVEGPPRWMSMTSSGSSRLTARPIVSDLRSMPGPAGGGDAEGAAEGGAEGGADAGDLVLGLEGADAEVLVLGELVEDVGGRGDRVGAEEQRQLRQVGGGDQAPGEGGVAGDVGVGARARAAAGRDLVGGLEQLGRLAEVVAGLEGAGVGVERPAGVLAKRFVDPLEGRLDGPACTSS